MPIQMADELPALAECRALLGVRRVSGGIPACCFDMLCTPAAGDNFIILDRAGRQKRIHNGLTGVSLIDFNNKWLTGRETAE